MRRDGRSRKANEMLTLKVSVVVERGGYQFAKQQKVVLDDNALAKLAEALGIPVPPEQQPAAENETDDFNAT